MKMEMEPPVTRGVEVVLSEASHLEKTVLREAQALAKASSLNSNVAPPRRVQRRKLAISLNVEACSLVRLTIAVMTRLTTWGI